MSACVPKQFECVRNISFENTKCQQKCSGLLVSSYKETQKSRHEYGEFLSNLNEAYWNYKGFYTFPSEYDCR